MHIKPKKDLVIKDPQNFYRAIPAEGIEVSDTDTYWLRRVMAGDVEVIGKNPLEPNAKVEDEKNSDKNDSKSFSKKKGE